ncbi:MAG: YtxH domain-containing protein [Acidimicrobiales bacterium]
MFLIRLLFSPLRITLFLARVIGYSRFGLFLIGVAIGLCFAPMTGRELRERLSDRVQQLTAGNTTAVTGG